VIFVDGFAMVTPVRAIVADIAKRNKCFIACSLVRCGENAKV
jgi:hypothetical protein